jgi:hypothetical protein
MRFSAVLSIPLFAQLLIAGCYHNAVKSDGPAFAFNGSTAAAQSPTSAISVSPAEPGSLTPVTLSFSLVNYTGGTLPALAWQVRLDSIDGPVLASGTVPSIGPYGSSGLLSAVVAAPAGGGTHDFFIYVDPGNVLNQRTVQSSIDEVTITFADFDLSFANSDSTITDYPSVAPASPTTTTPLTISFAVFNNDTSGNLTTATGVGYQVLEYGVAIASGTIPSIPAASSAGVAALLPAPTAGLHEYTVVINPGDLIPEQDDTNDSFSVSITVPVPN